MEEKKYEDALERAREIYFNKEYKPNEAALVKETLAELFPELRESEDEKVRKQLLDFVQRYTLASYSDRDKWVAYLEKMKDFDKRLEDAYKTADEVQYKRGYDKGYMDGYWYWRGAIEELEKQATIKDGNSIDPHFGKHIITDCGAKEKIQEKIIELSHKEDQVWSEEDDKILCGVIDEIQANKSSAPEYDLKTYDKFLSWLKSIKDRIQPQPKQVGWSEEDQNFSDFLEGYLEFDYSLSTNDKANTLDWLKSIKQRLS